MRVSCMVSMDCEHRCLYSRVQWAKEIDCSACLCCVQHSVSATGCLVYRSCTVVFLVVFCRHVTVVSYLTAAGNFDAAMKTAIKLCEYDDILQPKNIYALLCVTALKNKFFGICSKAFVKV